MEQPMTHYWYFKKYLPERHGEPCRVLCRGTGPGPRNVMVEFADGFRTVSIRFCVRKIKETEQMKQLYFPLFYVTP
jgi:hypothetical protein